MKASGHTTGLIPFESPVDAAVQYGATSHWELSPSPEHFQASALVSNMYPRPRRCWPQRRALMYDGVGPVN